MVCMFGLRRYALCVAWCIAGAYEGVRTKGLLLVWIDLRLTSQIIGVDVRSHGCVCWLRMLCRLRENNGCVYGRSLGSKLDHVGSCCGAGCAIRELESCRTLVPNQGDPEGGRIVVVKDIASSARLHRRSILLALVL